MLASGLFFFLLRFSFGQCESFCDGPIEKCPVFAEISPVGFKMATVHPAFDFVSQHIHANGHWEPLSTWFVKYILDESYSDDETSRGIVVDVGANIGYFSFMSAALGYNVSAFEPQSRIRPYFMTTMASDSKFAHSIALHEVALSSESGKSFVITGPSSNWGAARLVNRSQQPPALFFVERAQST